MESAFSPFPEVFPDATGITRFDRICGNQFQIAPEVPILHTLIYPLISLIKYLDTIHD